MVITYKACIMQWPPNNFNQNHNIVEYLKKVKVMNLRFQITNLRLCHSSLITAESIMMNHEAFRLFLHSISIYRRLPASKFGFRV